MHIVVDFPSEYKKACLQAKKDWQIAKEEDMDRKLMKLVVAMALFGDAKVSIIKLKCNRVYRNPEFVPIDSTDHFGIKSDSEEQGGGWTATIPFSDVDYIY